MAWTRILVSTSLLVAGTWSPVAAVQDVVVEEDPVVRVIVGFSDAQLQADFAEAFTADRTESTLSSASNQYSFRHGNAMAMDILTSQLPSLEADPRVDHVSRDSIWRLFAEEMPLGVTVVQGDSTVIPPPVSTSGNCDDTSSIKVCVVDSGLHVDHEDIPYQRNGFDIDGDIFGLDPKTIAWHNPGIFSNHGTHVAGTILAQSGNDIGVVGVIPDPQGVCLLIARVFDDVGSQSSSNIAQAVEWCADKGAHVVNLSLGGTRSSPDTDIQKVYDGVYESGVLLVAAAGNDGTSGTAYPASFDSVVSVAAVDGETLERADFSQHNSAVDIAAPGVDVVSTVVASQFLVSIGNTGSFALDPMPMTFSPTTGKIDPNDQLEYVDCDTAFSKCKDVKDKVCLIERGETYFTEKAKNCEDGGGILALIFNNESGGFGGTLGDENHGIKIPTFSLPREQGLFLLDNIDQNPTLTINEFGSGYGSYDGTSMASPHVAGVAAKIWAARPECTNVQIREALLATARDLGRSGKDDEFGHGLVQAEDAYLYLLSEFDEPCGMADVAEQPSDEPSSMPSSPPSPTPTSEPTGVFTQSCLASFEPCGSHPDCCSGRCASIAVGGATICRAQAKVSKAKLAGERGGAAAVKGSNTRDRQRRRRVRGKVVQPAQELDAPTESGTAKSQSRLRRI